MAHAGTMVGGSAQTKQNGSPWPAIALTLAVVVATIAGVWLASSAGIVDAAKVTRSALQNAASIAAMVLTTETLISDLPEKEKAGAGAGHDHGGGMDF